MEAVDSEEDDDPPNDPRFGRGPDRGSCHDRVPMEAVDREEDDDPPKVICTADGCCG